MYQPRIYRQQQGSPDLVSFRVSIGETDLFISAEKDLSVQAYEHVRAARAEIEAEIARNPRFLSSLRPLLIQADCPPLVRAMYEAGQRAGVGPMAAVAGAIGEYVARQLLRESSQIILENGGDLYIINRDSRVVGILAGASPLSNKIGLRIPPGEWAICTSSGTVGHSLSFGRADAATIIAQNGALADALATALGNRVKSPADVEKALEWARGFPEVRQALVIINETLGVWGEFELLPLQ